MGLWSKIKPTIGSMALPDKFSRQHLTIVLESILGWAKGKHIVSDA